ncbi:MAG TPA: IS630 family transposase [Blastocatellia bacterium]
MKTPTRFVLPLTTEEREILETTFKTHSSHSARIRAHAILLSDRQFSIDEIAEIFNVHRNTVVEWFERWQKERSVEDISGRGRKPKLDEEEQKEVIEILDQHPQSSRQALGKIEQQMGQTISRDTLRRIAKKQKRSWKRVRLSKRSKRDEADFQASKTELEVLETEAQETGEFDVAYSDEAGFALGTVIPYAWQEVGETIELPAKDDSDRLNVFGIFTRQNKLYSMVFEGTITSEIVVACIDGYSLGLVKPTLLIIDGASIHVSKEFQARLKVWEERDLFIYLLPGYSPELNIIEILWRMIKYHWLPLAAYQSFKLLSKYLVEVLSQVGSKHQINFAH